MTKPLTPPPTPGRTRTGPTMYVVPAWVAVWAALLVFIAAAVLVWVSPAVGLPAALTLILVTLAAFGLTPTSVQERTGRLTDMRTYLADAEQPTPVLIGGQSIRRALGPLGFEYDGPDLLSTSVQQMADHYRAQPESRDAADVLDALINRAQRAYDDAARRKIAA